LIDQSRSHIERHYRRPFAERFLRWSIANALTRPLFTRVALRLARLAVPLRALLPRRMRTLAKVAIDMPIGRLRLPNTASERRLALLPGCVQQVIAPEIDEAAGRLLARRKISLMPLDDAGCCGALSYHLGREAEAKAWAKRAIEAFERAGGPDTFEGILITATGCAAHIQEYEWLFLQEPEWRARAEAFAVKFVPFESLLGEVQGKCPTKLRAALQVPCSQQHGLRWPDGGALLREAGFEVLSIPEGHLCCGSAGSYSILQPEIANALRQRKLDNIRSVKPDLVVTSNIGCLQHLKGPDAPPIVHIAQLLDWAEGGPMPKALHARAQLMAAKQATG
jgi:glycolate dehydrogenase iron-sulfur subunit